MTGIVKRLDKWADDLEHDRDYELEFELSGEEAGEFAEDIRGALTRIEKLEAVVRDMLAWMDVMEFADYDDKWPEIEKRARTLIAEEGHNNG